MYTGLWQETIKSNSFEISADKILIWLIFNKALTVSNLKFYSSEN